MGAIGNRRSKVTDQAASAYKPDGSMTDNETNTRVIKIATVTHLRLFEPGHNKIGIEDADGTLRWYELIYGDIPADINPRNPINQLNSSIPSLIQRANGKTDIFVVRELRASQQSAEQMIAFAERLVEMRDGRYNLLTNSCTSFCAAVLRYGGLNVPILTVRPVDLDTWVRNYNRRSKS